MVLKYIWFVIFCMEREQEIKMEINRTNNIYNLICTKSYQSHFILVGVFIIDNF
jgi:hypothetical protein